MFRSVTFISSHVRKPSETWKRKLGETAHNLKAEGAELWQQPKITFWMLFGFGVAAWHFIAGISSVLGNRKLYNWPSTRHGGAWTGMS